MTVGPAAGAARGPASLAGRVVLVTGAARGLGRGIAAGFAREGARVALADLGALAAERVRDAPYPLSGAAELTAAVEELRCEGHEAIAVEVDVSDESSCRAALARVAREWGRLDVLINNAGLLAVGPFDQMAEADWDRVFAVNVKGTFLMCRAAVGELVDGGAIINISSLCGRAGFPLISAYCASKFAILGLTQSMALELAPRGIRVNAVCPGFVDTALLDHLERSGVWETLGLGAGTSGRQKAMEMIPLGGPQRVEDVADAAVYLAWAPQVTGTSLLVAGGQLTG